MTWKQFREFAESHGVKDETEIRYIDFSAAATNVEFDDDNKVIIE